MSRKFLPVAMLAGLAVGGCGGGGGGSATPLEGTLLQTPTSTLSVSASQFTSMLAAGGSSGQSLLQLSTGDASGATPLSCGVAVYHYDYETVDGQGKPATASGALMLPTGSTPGCSGARPLLEYAHGTNLYRSYDLAALNDPTNPAYGESALIASMYAAQGYIVIAPNYVGYDTSNVDYHPYLVKAQQASDMIDALQAGRTALAQLAGTVSAGGKFFLTGYSQGGYVALATEQAMQQRGMSVTAASPGSGPYALAAMVDYIFLGHPDLGAPQFGSLLVEGYQNSYGNVYASPSQLFANNLYTAVPYATAAAASASPLAATLPMFSLTAPTSADVTAMPSNAGASAGATLNLLLPDTVPPYYSSPSTSSAVSPDPGVINQTLWTELFDTSGSNTPYDAFGTGFGPLWSTYFSSGTELIAQNYRANYLADAVLNPDGLFTGTTGLPTKTATNGLREDLAANDLRGYKPSYPTMLCGGSSDPIVYYPLNTMVMQQEWGTPTSTLFSLDVDSTPASSGPTAAFAPIQQAFAAWKTATATSGGQSAVVAAYHTTVGGYCALAARSFFANF